MMKDAWARKQQEAPDLRVLYQKYPCQEIHLKWKGSVLYVWRLTQASGGFISSLKEPGAALSYCLKSWILSQKINLLLTVTALFYDTIQQVS